jgi:hypothetical protein
MKKFDSLCETFGVIKQTKKIMYPRQIQLSEEFIQALKNEYFRMKLEEDTERPVKNRGQKFIKALQFHLKELEENSTHELEAYKRMMDENTEEYVAKVEGKTPPKKGDDKAKEQKRRKEIPTENMERG